MISIRGLRKNYGSVVALSSLDLDAQAGEVVALLGPSGCGKSTTLQLLAGFLEPDGGEITVGHRVLSRAGQVVPPERRGMSLIFQSYAVWPHKTVAENVAFGLQVRKVSKPEIKTRVEKVLSVVRLDNLAERYPSELSGGQQQRVALARALVVEPEILLLDEPLSNLDANLREEMRFEIRRLHDTTGITMVYVTHDQTEAMVCADRIAVMNKGGIEQIGTPVEIYEQPQTQFVASFIGRSNTIPVRLVERGVVQIGDLSVRGVDDTSAVAGAAVTLCVRPHRVSLSRAPEEPANRMQGRIERAAYLGETRDYLIELTDGTRIRSLAPPEAVHAPGSTVDVFLPVSDCRIVAQ
ncbi:MAG: ABC transporter ATP-binding protein [Rhizobiales bacterium]|jgi:iron(III) transport system ATP-binding protein|nr:ABC transporter ATP-binding protein [Hyphomicrobiales bacterium]